MIPPFEVRAYSIDTLRLLLAEKAKADPSAIAAKTHLVYFESYFSTLSAKTIVVENDYIDRDFLEDFAAYYVRCFNHYDRRCTRLHFFDQSFPSTEFSNLLRGQPSSLSVDLLQKAYLGFVVVKPLPRTVIGRTCLKTYTTENGRRCYPITRGYHANLFGMTLQVDSLAFQEQDSVVAACATSALWTAFHGTGMLFQHAILSPVEITKIASASFASESRNLPNNGLTIAQMSLAIRGVGLEPVIIGTSDQFIFKSALYAYLRCRVPILMMGALVDAKTPADCKIMGQHAVAITGFGCDSAKANVGGPDGFISRSCYIDRVYAHDDQVGPFARMILDDAQLSVGAPAQPLAAWSLKTSWKATDGSTGNVRFHPHALLVPLYHKIRIPFEAVQHAVFHFDAFFEFLRQNLSLPFTERLKWDVYLTTVDRFKSELMQTGNLTPDLRLDILCRALPRFIWRATATCVGQTVVDLLFDATDIEQGRYFVQAVKYDLMFSGLLQAVLALPQIDAILNSLSLPASSRTILEQFK